VILDGYVQGKHRLLRRLGLEAGHSLCEQDAAEVRRRCDLLDVRGDTIGAQLAMAGIRNFYGF
jgi:hypothetical protein